MADSQEALVYDFRVSLEQFGELTEQQATTILHESAETVAEAIIVGNEFGPGVQVDSGFARSSFRIGINQPVGGDIVRPKLSRRVTKPGTQVFNNPPDLAPIESAKLGDEIFITTPVEYPQYLEFEPKTRRYGKNAGASTVFIEPVEARFEQIVDNAADRAGFGR